MILDQRHLCHGRQAHSEAQGPGRRGVPTPKRMLRCDLCAVAVLLLVNPLYTIWLYLGAENKNSFHLFRPSQVGFLRRWPGAPPPVHLSISAFSPPEPLTLSPRA